ncbi:HlyD family efflux transporter periplasmic adaptor subunit [Enterobacter sp. SGAir0187]|uniref:HlyD family secretion protein n=1 Tax=Enterobacter sp. SGAir0187 TaxID=2836161 RepID=UPI000CEB487D|nr:HlyD family efflux transporter periplasmic adaptor subunit [Enterobacter sp. SGAir0187]AVH17535.1 HlyD family efflux transporter periplasmic adaptor subunit [Enterobacter sp. SGAir0187]
MSETLFRQQAIDNNRVKSLGSVILFTPPYRWLLVVFVGMIGAAIVTLLIFGSYTKRESARGTLVPEQGILDIVPVGSGTLTDIFIHEGQRVKKGEKLAAISSDISTAMGATHKQIAQQLNEQREVLKSELVNLDAINSSTMQGIHDRIGLLKEQIAQLQLINNQRRSQIGIEQEKLKNLRSLLAEGYASNTQIDQQESVRLEAVVRMQDVGRQLLELKQQLAQLEQQYIEQPINYLKQKNEVNQKIAELNQTMLENESRRGTILTAPADSIVGSVLVKKGQIVTSGQTIASLIPSDGNLQARVMISSRAIGFIKPGQKVVLRYDSFPYQKFGQQYGSVLEVSESALTPKDVASVTGDNLAQEQFYQVKIVLKKQSISAYGIEHRLPPGSAVNADFIVDKRHLYQWVLEPLYALGKRF